MKDKLLYWIRYVIYFQINFQFVLRQILVEAFEAAVRLQLCRLKFYCTLLWQVTLKEVRLWSMPWLRMESNMNYLLKLKIQIFDFLEYNFLKKTYQVEECRKGTKKSFQKCYKHKSKIHPQFLPEQDTQFPRKIRKKWGWPNKSRNLPKWSKRTIAK